MAEYRPSVATSIKGLSRTPNLGYALGTGLGGGLSALAEGQLNVMLQRKQKREQDQQRRSTAFSLESLLGVSPEEAASLSQMQPELLRSIIPQMQKKMQMQQTLEQYRQSNQTERGSVEDIQEDSIVTEQERQGLGNENAEASKAFEQAFLLSNGNTAIALRAESDTRKRMQRDRIAEEKKGAMLSREKEKRITSALGESRKEAKVVNDRIEASRESINAYKSVRKLLKSGKPLTGLPMKALKYFGLEKSTTGWETQLVDKYLAGEPIRALSYIPPQAARLSKVFDTLKDMHGSLINTSSGLDAIARAKIVDAKARKAVDKEYIRLLEIYRKQGKEPPYTIRKTAAKNIAKKLDKYGAELEYIVSDSIEKNSDTAKLKDYKVGEFVVADDGSGLVFKKENLFGKMAWVKVEG